MNKSYMAKGNDKETQMNYITILLTYLVLVKTLKLAKLNKVTVINVIK